MKKIAKIFIYTIVFLCCTLYVFIVNHQLPMKKQVSFNVFTEHTAVFQQIKLNNFPVHVAKPVQMFPKRYMLSNLTSFVGKLRLANHKDFITMATYGATDYISSDILSYQKWESDITVKFENILTTLSMDNSCKINNQNINLFLDVGSNIGTYSLIAMHYKWNVVAIDASQNSLRLLIESMYLNKFKTPNSNSDKDFSVTLFNGAIYKHHGFNLKLPINLANQGGSSIFADENHFINNTAATQVPTYSISTFAINNVLAVIPNQLLNTKCPFIMKIDIEMAEFYVFLYGGNQLFDALNITHIFMEFAHIRRGSTSVVYRAMIIVGFLLQRHFLPYDISSGVKLNVTDHYSWPDNVLFEKN